MDAAIDHGNVDAAPCMGKAKLVDDKRIGVCFYASQALGVKCDANVIIGCT